MNRTSSRPGKLRTAIAIVAAAGLMVAGAGALAEAAGGAKPLLLGKNNKAKKTTKISNKKAGPVLALKAKSGPALSVNTADLIANLNADLLDGQSLEQVSPTLLTASIGTPGGTMPSAVYLATTQVPAGTYRMTIDGLVDLSAGNETTCLLYDYTKLVASGGTDITSAYVSHSTEDVNFHVEALGTVVAGHQTLFACGSGGSPAIAQPVTLLLERVDRTAGIPGLAPFTPRPGRPLPQAGSLH